MTPRTDAAVSDGYRFTTETGTREYVPADFARDLERESKRHHEQFCSETLVTDRLTRENAKLREAMEGAHSALGSCIHDRWDECLVERAYFKLKAAL